MALAGPDDEHHADDLIAEASDIIQRVQDLLGDAVNELPGPVLTMGFGAAVTAANRDIDRDFNADVAIDDLQLNAGKGYGLLMRDIHNSEPLRRATYALTRLRLAESAQDFKNLLKNLPEVTSPLAKELLEEMIAEARDDVELKVLCGMREMQIELGRDAPEEAWTIRCSQLKDLWKDRFIPRLNELEEELQTSLAASDLEQIVILGEELLEHLGGTYEETDAWACCSVADALCQLFGRGRSENLERAIQLFERALRLLDDHSHLDRPSQRARILNGLGGAFSHRIEGDRALNIERSMECCREALGLTSMEGDGELWAMLQTNLAWALIERQYGEQDSNLKEAAEHFEAALEWRSFERDPLGWAYTHLNLGLLFSRRGERNDRETAILHAKEARRGAVSAANPALIAQSEHNISAEIFALAALEDVTSSERSHLLAEAEKHARTSLSAFDQSHLSPDVGRTWAHLGDILRGQGGRDHEARDAYMTSLLTLTTSSAPRECRNAAWSLANVEMGLGNIDAAVRAWDVALDAAEIVLTSRSDRVGRLEETRATVTLHRFASYAYAKVGQVTRAIEILERGRAREAAVLMQRDLIDLELLEFLDKDLHADFIEARRQLEAREGSPDYVTEGSPAPWEHFQRILQRVRLLPGLSNALGTPHVDDISKALSRYERFLYLVSSPAGSAALCLVRAADGEAAIEFVDVPELTSSELANELLGLVDSDESNTQPAFIWAQSGESGDIDQSLENLETTVGSKFLKPLHARLQLSDVRRLVIVATGLFGLLPVHSLCWRTDKNSRCLLDEYEVTYAPSASVHLTCRKRAAERGRSVTGFLGVGNPLPHGSPLAAAEYETKTVATSLGCTDTRILQRYDATKTAIEELISSPSHIHFACHGQASFVDEALSAGLSVAHEESLTALEVLETQLSARLVVLSACETGVVQSYWIIDEAFSLETSFLVAGASTVISTLWAVEDISTSLLMCDLYERVATGEDPVSALRRSQLWLRTLSGQAANDYISARSLLRAQQQEAPSEIYRSTDRPFRSYRYWAGFKVSGA